MPVSARISDAELRQRLEDHAYNVPPITDTTRAILIKKLNQLDTQRSTNLRKQGTYSGLDYSSAEDDDFPAPIANSTRRGGRAPVAVTGGGAGKGGKRGTRQVEEEVEVSGGVTSRVTRSSRNNSRAGTPQNGSNGRNGGQSRRNVSLMTHSETEEGSEEDEDEEEDIEEEEEEEEEESEDEEEVNGVDRVDLAVQTSLMDSPSPTRFRGQRLANTNYSPTSQSTSYTTTPTFPIMSPYLRKNINKHGSLNEALSTLPSPKSKPLPSTPDSTTSPTTQASPRQHSSPHSQSYSRDTSGPCSYMIVSALIMAVAAFFFLFLLVQYLSLVPPQSHSGTRVPVCGGMKGELAHIDCVPSSELNQTVELYKMLVKLLPSPKGCLEEHSMVSKTKALEQLSVPSGLEVGKLNIHLDNLLVLLRQNPGWGIMLEDRGEETSLGVVRNSSWACSFYKWGVQLMDLMWRLAWVIFGVVASFLVLVGLFKANQWRQARIKKKDEEVFQLVRQATNFLYQQHQMAAREGKGGPSYLAINHIRDQLIPPQDRVGKAEVWAEVVEYIEKNESRVRQDVQKIFGEDFRVWQWLPEIPWSPGSSPSSPSGPSSPSPNSHSTPTSSNNPWPHVPTTQGVVGWQGCAFPLGKHVAAPLAPPTSCLKVRHMFDVLQQGPGWVTLVKEEILRRCAEAAILHIAVDTQSEEGTVYIKTAGMEDAGKVFRCLHGQWYRGQLVTAKYLRLERYHERFPDAKGSCVAMKSSK